MKKDYALYWQEFKRKYPSNLPESISLLQFGNTPDMANELSALVLCGKKTATSSLVAYQEFQKRELSQVGECYLLLDGSDSILGVVQVVNTAKIAFGEIQTDFALAEGDGSYQNWHHIHQAYYQDQMNVIGKELTVESLLHCEWFKLIS